MTKPAVVLLVVVLGAVALAQNRPDFSGVWVPVASKASATAGAGGSAALPPSDITIRHATTSLSVSRTAFDIVNTQTYKLDGSESSNKSGAVTRVTHSRWDGPRLVIEGKASQVTSAGYAAWTLKETYSIDSRGRLILESEYVSADGTATTRTQEFSRKASK